MEPQRGGRRPRTAPEELRRRRRDQGPGSGGRGGSGGGANRVPAPQRDGHHRDLNYVVRNVPGFIPFETLPANTQSSPEMFGSLTADYTFPEDASHPGHRRAASSCRRPSRASSLTAGSPRREPSSYVSKGTSRFSPMTRTATPIFQGRVSLRWDLSTMLERIHLGPVHPRQQRHPRRHRSHRGHARPCASSRAPTSSASRRRFRRASRTPPGRALRIPLASRAAAEAGPSPA